MAEQQDGHEDEAERGHEEEEHAHEPGRAESDGLADY